MKNMKQLSAMMLALLAGSIFLGPTAFTQANMVRVSGKITPDTTWTSNNVKDSTSTMR